MEELMVRVLADEAPITVESPAIVELPEIYILPPTETSPEV